jgi:hypothetical protein
VGPPKRTTALEALQVSPHGHLRDAELLGKVDDGDVTLLLDPAEDDLHAFGWSHVDHLRTPGPFRDLT